MNDRSFGANIIMWDCYLVAHEHHRWSIWVSDFKQGLCLYMLWSTAMVSTIYTTPIKLPVHWFLTYTHLCLYFEQNLSIFWNEGEPRSSISFNCACVKSDLLRAVGEIAKNCLWVVPEIMVSLACTVIFDFWKQRGVPFSYLGECCIFQIFIFC